MESKELEEVVLPVQLLEMIALEADEVTKEKSKGGSKDFALGFQHGYFIGATEWAQWKVKCDELREDYIDLGKQHNTAQTTLTEQAIQYQALKERCEKMEAALKQIEQMSDPGSEWKAICDMKSIATEALKEGESNTPAPIKEIEYMPILSAELIELRAFNDVPARVPMHLLNEDQANRNHGQTLQRLKERGGLGIKEALSLMTLKNWSYYRDLPMKEALAMLNDLIANNNPQ